MMAPDVRIGMIGIASAVAGSAALSINDVALKFLSGGYALHQIVLIRALIGVCLLLAMMPMLGTGFHQIRTRRIGAHGVRVSLILMSNMTFFLGLAAMPLAEAVAIAFVSPLLVTAMSVVVLGEQVGPRRWTAVAVGMVGVIVMIRPGSDVFQPASLLVLFAAFTYAATQIMTRHMRETESAITMNFFVQLGFITLGIFMGLTVGAGQFAGSADPSLAFLFRPWIWPAPGDWPILGVLAVAVTAGGLLITQAYRLAPAATIAPFEYTAMPFAILWGITVFDEWPDATVLTGIALICGAGLYALRREQVRKAEA